MCNVMTLIKSVFNENHNHYYFEAFLEKFSYKQCKNASLRLK